jgi:hypothetical protein
MDIIDWKNFTFPVNQYERMSQYLPFSLIMMRRGFFCFLFLRSSGDRKQVASALSQHKSWKNLQIYVENAIISEHTKIKK